MEIRSSHGVQFGAGSPVVKGSLRDSTVPMRMSDERHMSAGVTGIDQESSSFATALNRALSSVEGMDNTSTELTTRAVYDPDSVDVHSVMIAAEKARFALTLTKTVADGFVKTFRELTNPR